MTLSYPLDRPVWHALTTRQSGLALGDARALRIQPDYGLFAAAADTSPDSLAALAALVPEDGALWLVEAGDTPPAPGVANRQVSLHQMVAASVEPATTGFAIVPLTEDDAPEMRALATLTEPGPFFARTHQLGDFVGVKRDGRLVAMAGERMKLDGFTEVSGVCTHPDHRGHGYAGGLMRVVAQRILARGEVPFLHVYPDNRSAIALYEALGFTLRSAMTVTVLTRA